MSSKDKNAAAHVILSGVSAYTTKLKNWHLFSHWQVQRIGQFPCTGPYERWYKIFKPIYSLISRTGGHDNRVRPYFGPQSLMSVKFVLALGVLIVIVALVYILGACT